MKTILIVDASAICREPMAAILESHGYRVLRAADGVDALARVRAEEPDLILLDIVMPKMDGLAVIQVLRDDPRHKDRPIILVTGMTDRACILKARALGVQGYVLKTSFSVDLLLSRIRAALKNAAKAEQDQTAEAPAAVAELFADNSPHG